LSDKTRTIEERFLVFLILSVQGIFPEITSWNEVAGAESAKPRLTMNSNQPWRRRLRHSHPPVSRFGNYFLDDPTLSKVGVIKPPMAMMRERNATVVVGEREDNLRRAPRD
jgi:hypothetical protein